MGLDGPYLFLLMKEFDTVEILFGVAICIGSASSLIMYPLGLKVIKFLRGPMNTMLMALSVTVVKYTVYKFSPTLYLIIVMQVTSGINISLFNLSVMTHTEKIASKDIKASMFGIVNALMFGAGIMLANIAGGRLYQDWGIKNMFLSAGVFNGFWALLVLLFITLTRKQNFPEESHQVFLSQERVDDLPVEEI